MNTAQALKNVKIEALNPMQLDSLAAAKKHKGIIILSPTGSGKTTTLASCMGMVERLTAAMAVMPLKLKKTTWNIPQQCWWVLRVELRIIYAEIILM